MSVLNAEWSGEAMVPGTVGWQHQCAALRETLLVLYSFGYQTGRRTGLVFGLVRFCATRSMCDEPIPCCITTWVPDTKFCAGQQALANPLHLHASWRRKDPCPRSCCLLSKLHRMSLTRVNDSMNLPLHQPATKYK